MVLLLACRCWKWILEVTSRRLYGKRLAFMYCMFSMGCGLWHGEFFQNMCGVTSFLFFSNKYGCSYCFFRSPVAEIVTYTSTSCTIYQLDFFGTSPMLYQIHLFSFLLNLVTYIFLAEYWVFQHYLSHFFFISDAKWWELWEVCIYKMYPNVWKQFLCFSNCLQHRWSLLAPICTSILL